MEGAIAETPFGASGRDSNLTTDEGKLRKARWTMGQTQKVSGVATSIRGEGDWTHVRYHSTDVVSFNAKEIILRTGGWGTVTTKARMNQAANQFSLGFSVFQKDHSWYVRLDSDGSVVRFNQTGVHTILR